MTKPDFTDIEENIDTEAFITGALRGYLQTDRLPESLMVMLESKLVTEAQKKAILKSPDVWPNALHWGSPNRAVSVPVTGKYKVTVNCPSDCPNKVIVSTFERVIGGHDVHETLYKLDFVRTFSKNIWLPGGAVITTKLIEKDTWIWLTSVKE